MNAKVLLRSETPTDLDVITEVTVAAFATLAISRHTEQFVRPCARLGPSRSRWWPKSRAVWSGTSPSRP